MMDYQRLWNLISQEPFASLDDEACAVACNDTEGPYVVTVIVDTQVDELDILRHAPSLDAGEAFLGKIETLITSDNVLKRMARNLAQGEGGINVGHAAVRAKLDELVGTGGILQGEVDQVKALAEVNVSPASHAGLPRVKVGYVIKARAQFGPSP